MPLETDKKLHEELEEKNWQQDRDNQNRYWGQKETGGYDIIETDGDYYRVNDGSWTKR